MKKFVSLFLATAIAVNIVACTSLPAKKDTVLAPYSKLLVKPLSFDNIYLNNFDSIDLLSFYNSRSQLVKIFNDNFNKFASKTGYFDQIVFEGNPDASTLVLEPTLSMIDPGLGKQSPETGTGAVICHLSDGVTNKKLGSYKVSRSVKRPAWSPTMKTIISLISGMGEDAASHIAEVK